LEAGELILGLVRFVFGLLSDNSAALDKMMKITFFVMDSLNEAMFVRLSEQI